MPSDRQLVIADIPGLIEGASAGAGLGHEFLAHVERTRLLVHVLDLAPLDGSDPADNFEAIEHELALHDPRLAALPRILALSKADLVDEPTRERQRDRWAQRLGPEVPVLVTSAVARIGLDELARELIRRIPAPPAEPDADSPAAPAAEAAHDGELAEHRVFRPAAGRSFTVQRTGEGSYRVSGKGIERLVARYDLDNEDALAHLERRLRGIGVITELESKGFQPGDEVEIAGVLFDLDPSI